MRTALRTMQRCVLMLVLLWLPALVSAQQQVAKPAGEAAPKPLTKQQLREQKQAKKKLAANERQNAKARTYMEKHPPKETDVVYLFGVGMNFNDSTIYVTDILPVNYMKLTKRTKFLPYRAEFSLQFKEYLEGTLGLKYETTSVFFATKRKTAAKRYYKLKKRYLDEGDAQIVVVDAQQFQFKKPEIDNVAI
ncbi:MAG: hypothetical protein J1F25_05680 [Prevotellaceae bacterium]|nr:hypothetical protein [Prevotellaceae bacterium]